MEDSLSKNKLVLRPSVFFSNKINLVAFVPLIFLFLYGPIGSCLIFNTCHNTFQRSYFILPIIGKHNPIPFIFFSLAWVFLTYIGYYFWQSFKNREIRIEISDTVEVFFRNIKTHSLPIQKLVLVDKSVIRNIFGKEYYPYIGDILLSTPEETVVLKSIKNPDEVINLIQYKMNSRI